MRGRIPPDRLTAASGMLLSTIDQFFNGRRAKKACIWSLMPFQSLKPMSKQHSVCNSPRLELNAISVFEAHEQHSVCDLHVECYHAVTHSKLHQQSQALREVCLISMTKRKPNLRSFPRSLSNLTGTLKICVSSSYICKVPHRESHGITSYSEALEAAFRPCSSACT